MTSVKSLGAWIYRLKSWYVPTGVDLNRFSHRDDDQCWWFGGIVSQPRWHLFGHCSRLKDNQKHSGRDQLHQCSSGSTKVLGKQKQCNESTATIASRTRTAVTDPRRRKDPRARAPAPARPQQQGAHRNPHNGVRSRKGLAEHATDVTRRPTSTRQRELRGFPQRSDDRIQSEREQWAGRGRS
jgi:hypothetical protein